jgi:saccharopine dehydrogenase-like NADP-dependent oxidoreductase
LFDEEPMEIRGQHVRPIDVTAGLLFPKWQHDPNEPEFTVMRVTVDGTQNGTATRYTYDLYDEFDEATHMSSMSRTTGFPPAILARKLASGELEKPGVFAPEGLADDEALVAHLREELAHRGVEIKERVTEA